MKTIFLSMLTNSAVVGAVVLACLLGSKALNRRVAARWKAGLWTGFCWLLVYPWRMTFDWLTRWSIRIEVPEVALTRTVVRSPVTMPAVPPAPARLAADAAAKTAAVRTVTQLDVLSALWAAGAVLFLAVSLWRYLRAWRELTRGSWLVEDEKTLSMLNSLAAGLGVKMPVLYRAPAAFAPMALWMCGKVILLPDADYDEETLSFILRHELTHIKRGDLSRKWLLLLANAVHWFNPIVWRMAREASADMERACDAAVVAAMEGDVRRAYADAILNAAQGRRGRNIALSTRFDGGAETLRERFQNIFSGPAGRRGCALILVITFTALLLAGLVSFTPEQPDAAGADTHVEDTRGEDACRQLAADFAAAYFGGDLESLRACLSDIWMDDPACFAEPDTVDPSALDTMRFSTVESGYMEICTIPFRSGAGEDNLKLRMIKQEDGWQVLSYWLDTEAVAEAESVARVYADAYFNGDAETMGTYTSLLSSTMPAAYAEPGAVDSYTLELGEMQEVNQNHCEAIVRFETADGASMMLVMALIEDAEPDGWRVLESWLEPAELTPEQEECAAAASAFADAYFSGDYEALYETLSSDRLLDSAEAPACYPDPGAVQSYELQVGEIQQYPRMQDRCWCTAVFYHLYDGAALHIGLIREDDGWKVSSYNVSGDTTAQLLLDAARREDAGIYRISIETARGEDYGMYYSFLCDSPDVSYEAVAIVRNGAVEALMLTGLNKDISMGTWNLPQE